MIGPTEADFEAAVAQLHEQRGLIEQFQERMKVSEGASTSKNRVVTAKVDVSGGLTELKLTGERWRDMSPGELTDLISKTIKDAQQDAKNKAMGAAAEFMPSAFDFLGVTGERPSIDDMFTSALELTRNPILSVDLPMPGGASTETSAPEATS